MAKTTNNVTPIEDKKPEIKPIVLRNNVGDVYILEFNRDSIKFAEARGFKAQTLEEGISMSAIEDLFFYSFRMHHPNMSKANTDKILYDELGGLNQAIIERLAELYLAPFNTLVATGDSAKNSKMTEEL